MSSNLRCSQLMQLVEKVAWRPRVGRVAMKRFRAAFAMLALCCRGRPPGLARPQRERCSPPFPFPARIACTPPGFPNSSSCLLRHGCMQLTSFSPAGFQQKGRELGTITGPARTGCPVVPSLARVRAKTGWKATPPARCSAATMTFYDLRSEPAATKDAGRSQTVNGS